MSSKAPEDLLFAFIKNTLYAPEKAVLHPEDFPESYQPLVQGMLLLNSFVSENRAFVTNLANGNLSCPLPTVENTIAAPAKELHASLMHLTWQANRVAQGDYEQQVDFMGEFSASFNLMIRQLRVAREKDQREKNAMRQLAFHDALTGAYNRHYGMEYMQDLVANESEFLVAFCDLDYLKYCNDEFGHNEGDRYILNACQVIQSIPCKQTLCRTGGDEFLIIAEGLDEAEFEAALKAAQQKLRSMPVPEGYKYMRNFSFGVIRFSGQCALGDLLSEADKRMYAQKLKFKEQYGHGQIRDSQGNV